MNYISEPKESVAAGLVDLKRYFEPSSISIFDLSLRSIEHQEGSRSGCLRNLIRHASISSMHAQFSQGNIQLMKQWSYVSTKLRIMLDHETPGTRNLEDVFWALICDSEEMFSWWRHYHLFGEDSQNLGVVQDLASDAFIRRQTLRALNGEWSELAAACDQALAKPEAFKQVRPRLIQFSFYRELARGDAEGMRRILLDMCSPKLRSRSYQYESGLTNNFIVMLATLFTKLAWCNGFEVEVDTPWIPKEWLPVRPNETYEDPWPFMQNFDIWQPFPEPWTRYSPVRPT